MAELQEDTTIKISYTLSLKILFDTPKAHKNRLQNSPYFCDSPKNACSIETKGLEQVCKACAIIHFRCFTPCEM